MSSPLPGVRALLFDLEGTVFQAGALIPGAAGEVAVHARLQTLGGEPLVVGEVDGREVGHGGDYNGAR